MATRLGERAAGLLRQLNRPVHRMSWLSTDRLPRPHDTERRGVAWTRWNEIAARPDDPAQVALLDALFGNSPYLDRNIPTKPDFYDRSVAPRSRRRARRPRGRARRRAIRPHATARCAAAVATALRRLKRQVALAVAVAGIAEVWSLEQVTGALQAPSRRAAWMR